jgi:hypothetical protein
MKSERSTLLAAITLAIAGGCGQVGDALGDDDGTEAGEHDDGESDDGEHDDGEHDDGESDDGESDDGESDETDASSTEPNDDGEHGPVCVDYGEPCTECEIAACPDLFCGCYGNVECGLLGECAIQCTAGDTACLTACATVHADGASVAALLSDCAATQCADECPLDVALDDCERCAYEACDAQMNACIAIEHCPPLLVCVIACAGDPLCDSGCAALYPAGVAAAQTVGECSVAQCSDVCL